MESIFTLTGKSEDKWTKTFHRLSEGGGIEKLISVR